MNRLIKNIIFSVLISLTCLSIFLTINYAKNHIVKNDNNTETKKTISNIETPTKEKNNDTNDSETSIDNNEETTHIKHEKKNNERPTENEENIIPPEKPEKNTPNQETGEYLEVYEETELTYKYYIIFGIESFITSILLMYLIMSNFNKKNIKETFNNIDKIIIYVLAIIIITTGISYLSGLITNLIL